MTWKRFLHYWPFVRGIHHSLVYSPNKGPVMGSLNVCFAVSLKKLLNNRFACDLTWWRHQMETFSALLAICAGNSPVPGEFPTQRPVTRSFDVFFYLRLNKRLSKQSWGWWLETLPCPLWRHHNEMPCPYLLSYPGYFWEPHWNSMGLPEISGVTWQVCMPLPWRHCNDSHFLSKHSLWISQVRRSFWWVSSLFYIIPM